MSIANINHLTTKALALATFSTNCAATCASSAYKYGKNKFHITKQTITPYTPAIVRYTETAAALIIAGIALRALLNLSIHLPIVDTLVAAVVAKYALRHPEQCAQSVALFAIGSVVIQTLAISTCSLSVIQGFGLSFAAISIADQVVKKI